jgi:transcription termination factor NusB
VVITKPRAGPPFGTEESVKFINGMLDAIRKKLETQ